MEPDLTQLPYDIIELTDHAQWNDRRDELEAMGYLVEISNVPYYRDDLDQRLKTLTVTSPVTSEVLAQIKVVTPRVV